MPTQLSDVGGLPGGDVLRRYLGAALDENGRTRAQILAEGQGLKGENFPRSVLSTAGQLMIDGTVYFQLCPFIFGDVVTNVHVSIGTGATGLTLSKVGIYKSDGTRLALSADLGSDWTNTGTRTNALSAPLTIPASGAYYVAIVAKVSTTMPTLNRATTIAGTSIAGVGSGVSILGTLAAQTDLPASAAIVQTSTIGFWVGWS